MALEDILEAIEAEADGRVASIITEAEATAAAVLTQARADAAELRERLSRSRDGAAGVAGRRILSHAHLEAARQRRAAREELYQSALEGGRRRLAAVRDGPGYDLVLGGLFDEAVAVLPDATVARVDPRDTATLRRLLEERDVAIEIEGSRNGWGGVELVADGRAVVNDLESRLDRADDHLRQIATEIIPALKGGGP